MKYLLISLLIPTFFVMETILYDFNSTESSGEWYVVNDDVMGGISTGGITSNPDGTATFRGELSPENNGGFASIRSMIAKQLDDKLTGVKIRLKGDGNIYSIRFRTNRNFDGFAYQAKISTTADKWQEIEIPFIDFQPTFRGYPLANKPALEPQNIQQIGILISDKQFGKFTMDIDWIKFCR